MSGPSLSSSVAGRPLRPATRLSLGGPLPHQLAEDVYKRQGLGCCPLGHEAYPSQPDSYDTETGGIRSLIGFGSLVGPLSHSAVSYTHLDVYKRQDY